MREIKIIKGGMKIRLMWSTILTLITDELYEIVCDSQSYYAVANWK